MLSSKKFDGRHIYMSLMPWWSESQKHGFTFYLINNIILPEAIIHRHKKLLARHLVTSYVEDRNLQKSRILTTETQYLGKLNLIMLNTDILQLRNVQHVIIQIVDDDKSKTIILNNLILILENAIVSYRIHLIFYQEKS